MKNKNSLEQLEDLKCCPFCGHQEDDVSKPHLRMFRGRVYTIFCMNLACDVQPETIPFLTVKEAVDAWNVIRSVD